MSVDQLQSAAEKLRTLAENATDGPWNASLVWSPDSHSTSGIYSHAHPAGTVESEVVASGRIKNGYGGIRNPHNAAYITAMQPRVALAVAEWLEATAKIADPGYGGPATHAVVDAAIETARAILGIDT